MKSYFLPRSTGFLILFLLLNYSDLTAQATLSKKGLATIENCQKYFEAHNDQHLEEFFELVAIPSISSSPSHREDVANAAAWIVRKLKDIGMTTAKTIPTEGNPVVYGSWDKAKGKPTVIIYAHYDVQPVKANEWEGEPFEPRLEAGKIFGRGASDDKAGIMIPIWAVEAFLKQGLLPVNVKLIFDGEEEIGSPHFKKFLADNKELLQADFALNADGSQLNDSTPVIYMSLRGGAQLEFIVKTADYDAHSGLYGGKTPNAAKAISEIIASFYNEDGSVAVEGFYDEVVPLTREEREMVDKIPYDPQVHMNELGTTAEVGEINYSPLERLWYRPTLEIVGVQGGYTEAEGFSNIVPGSTMARITCRLVPDQTGAHVIQSIVRHIDKYCPVGATVTYNFRPSYLSPMKFPANTKAHDYLYDVLTSVYGKEPFHFGTGGSVGPLIDIKEQLGLYAYSLGMGQPDERIHASNEFIRLASIRRGQMLYANYFMYVAEAEGTIKGR